MINTLAIFISIIVLYYMLKLVLQDIPFNNDKYFEFKDITLDKIHINDKKIIIGDTIIDTNDSKHLDIDITSYDGHLYNIKIKK